jgi:ribonuclease HII
MAEQDALYPGYGFASHVGYGTAAHSDAIDRLGVTPLHRLSFAPLAQYRTLIQDVVSDGSVTTEPTSKQIGDSAEDVACKYLSLHGHIILNRNWRTKFCEIDIISKKGDITPKKLKQMKFAVELYTLKEKINDIQLRLVAISVTGDPPMVEQFLEVV